MTDSSEDDIVEKVVERAAEKAVAAAVQPPICRSGMSRGEALVAIAVLIILNFSALFLALQNRNEGRERRSDIENLCALLSEKQPLPLQSVELVARCLD